MTDYKQRLPDKKTHAVRTPFTVWNEIVDLHMRVAQHQVSNAQAFWEDYTHTLLGARAVAPEDVSGYLTDALERSILFWDTMRLRGNRYIEHEAAGNPPVLKFTYDVVVSGMDLPQPVNYDLVRIHPQPGAKTDTKKRPFIVVDPRAGHGPGIAGFKPESQVGIVLADGHPVYFLVFRMHPVPGQTLRDVAQAEFHFFDWVAKRHPQSDKPCVIGNCQGGWAVIAVAASHPEIVGPIVLSGAPLSYWAGMSGKNPMRYLGGLIGGGWLASLMSDMGHGEFDGANLVANFETLDPANTLWSKYYRLYANIDKETQRFLDFELWWGGYMFLTSDEMRAILNNLFIGNKLSRGMISTGKGMHLDLRQIRQPIIIFCSTGDNITPPQQALNWIADLYEDERAIKAAGQVIVYMIHASSGHLGIFVSGAIVSREHKQIAATLEQIESLPPGLYEMKIVDGNSENGVKPDVILEERTIQQLLAQGGAPMRDDVEFELVKLISEVNGNTYELFISPVVRALSNPWSAHLMSFFHPLRVQHWSVSDINPWMAAFLPPMAKMAEEYRVPARPDNPLLAVESAQSKAIEYVLTAIGEMRDIACETLFYSVYGMMACLGVGERLMEHHAYSQEDEQAHIDALNRKIMLTAGEGDFLDAVVRMLLLLVHARGKLTRSGMEAAHRRLSAHTEFAGLTPERRRDYLQRQSVIVAYQPDVALTTLPQLLRNARERQKALAILDDFENGSEENSEAKRILNRVRTILEKGKNDAPKLVKHTG